MSLNAIAVVLPWNGSVARRLAVLKGSEKLRKVRKVIFEIDFSISNRGSTLTRDRMLPLFAIAL